MYWEEKIECLSRSDLESLQMERLQASLKKVYDHVPYYENLMKESGVTPEDVKSLDDLARLPFTTKEDLKKNYPFGLFAVPLEEIVRVHASSGTTGKPTVVGYTQKDISTWSQVMARCLTTAGTTSRDVVQVSYGYGLFTGGLGLHYGAEIIGALVVPMSGGNTKRQLMLMEDFGTTVLACTPSYALHMGEVMKDMGIRREGLEVKCGVFGAEPWSNEMREQIEEQWQIDALDIYGLSEIIGPGVAMECPYKDGMHICEDHFLPEIVDPVTGEVLPPGERGELVLTSLTKEAFPVIRYRTRDIVTLNYEHCRCGRTHARMSKVTGRTDDMLIIRGVNVFPSQIESVLLGMGQTEPHYLLVVDRDKGLDDLEVWVEVSKEACIDEVRGLQEISKRVQDEIESTLGISIRLKLVEPRTIQRSEGKAKRIVNRHDL